MYIDIARCIIRPYMCLPKQIIHYVLNHSSQSYPHPKQIRPKSVDTAPHRSPPLPPLSNPLTLSKNDDPITVPAPILPKIQLYSSVILYGSWRRWYKYSFPTFTFMIPLARLKLEGDAIDRGRTLQKRGETVAELTQFLEGCLW